MSKYFVHQSNGEEINIGSATAAKRFLRDQPDVQVLTRYWWSGTDLIECEDYTRAQILGRTARDLSKGETAQWSQDHPRRSFV